MQIKSYFFLHFGLKYDLDTLTGREQHKESVKTEEWRGINVKGTEAE